MPFSSDTRPVAPVRHAISRAADQGAPAGLGDFASSGACWRYRWNVMPSRRSSRHPHGPGASRSKMAQTAREWRAVQVLRPAESMGDTGGILTSTADLAHALAARRVAIDAGRPAISNAFQAQVYRCASSLRAVPSPSAPPALAQAAVNQPASLSTRTGAYR